MSLRLQSRLCLRVVLGALIAVSGTYGAAAYGRSARPVVVELYTSQGCSSCPPADAFLGRLAERKDVLALSLPITYWDMLGWKDTLATRANTDRQKSYAAFMDRGGVYTPQMIIDGVKDVVGSRRQAVEDAITAREAHLLNVPVTLKLRPTELQVHVAAAGRKSESGDATIWMLRIRPQATVTIDAGENGGRTVTYRNVVRAVKAIGIWKGKAISLDLPRDAIGGKPGDGIAVLVQRRGYGPIIGATAIDGMTLADAPR